ncbi:MAG: hypothetical protein KDD32_07720 [Bacteroidetes bacterium]|nr:hypothetical protein [Bacteroidota bacterium]
MDNNLSFHKTISRSNKPLTNDASWDKVLEMYKLKDYKATLLGILDYVDLGLVNKTGNEERNEFIIPHGSAELHLTISDNDFTVHAPFLNIKNSKKIPLMRKVAELNFSPLNLAAIRLNDDILSFHFSCPLELCEPYKIYEVLREICIYADSYDDEFISKFDASWIHQPKITPYSADQKQSAWDTMHAYIEEARSGISYFETKRSFNFAWDILMVTLMKIEYYIQPEGLLRIEIEKIVSYLISSRDALNDKINRGKNFLDKLSQYDRSKFDDDLYASETFIPYKIRSNEQAVKTATENAYVQAQKEREQGNHLAATMTIAYQFLYLMYHNNLPAGILNAIENSMEEAGGKSWKESSDILFDAMEAIMKGKKMPAEKKGFFKKLFGN